MYNDTYYFEIEPNKDTASFIKLYNKAIPKLQTLSGTGLRSIPFILWLAGNNPNTELLTIDRLTLDDYNSELKRKGRKRGFNIQELKERSFYRGLKELQTKGILSKPGEQYKLNSSLIFNGSRKEATGRKDGHFIKVYTNAIFYLQHLSGTGLKLLPYILWLISKRRGSHLLKIDSTSLNKFYKEIKKHEATSKPSPATFRRAIIELQDKNIIEKPTNNYQAFNIELFFNGDRSKAIRQKHNRILEAIKEPAIVKYNILDEIKAEQQKPIKIEAKITAIEKTFNSIYTNISKGANTRARGAIYSL